MIEGFVLFPTLLAFAHRATGASKPAGVRVI